jgi:hypothetical protein
MPTAGPNNPGTLADDASVGTVAWTNPGNAASSNNTYATVTASSATVLSHWLKATNFGFSIPAGSTVTNVKVEVERNYSGDAQAIDNGIKLVKGGVVSGNDKKNGPGVTWPGSDAYASYDFATDGTGWNVALTDGDVNASDFGVVFSASVTSALGPSTGSVDHIRITLTYTTAAGGGAQRSSASVSVGMAL